MKSFATRMESEVILSAVEAPVISFIELIVMSMLRSKVQAEFSLWNMNPSVSYVRISRSPTFIPLEVRSHMTSKSNWIWSSSPIIVPIHASVTVSLASIAEQPSFILKRIPRSSSPPRERRTVFKSLNPFPS